MENRLPYSSGIRSEPARANAVSPGPRSTAARLPGRRARGAPTGSARAAARRSPAAASRGRGSPPFAPQWRLRRAHRRAGARNLLGLARPASLPLIPEAAHPPQFLRLPSCCASQRPRAPAATSRLASMAGRLAACPSGRQRRSWLRPRTAPSNSWRASPAAPPPAPPAHSASPRTWRSTGIGGRASRAWRRRARAPARGRNCWNSRAAGRALPRPR
mmetsp:Transcript_118833/g.341167  ORF Transcript_118833/g.341167 Transcript_118833/m.341167 type:complete len:217 (-) Transcript_118833:827-1477(-)